MHPPITRLIITFVIYYINSIYKWNYTNTSPLHLILLFNLLPLSSEKRMDTIVISTYYGNQRSF